MLCEVFLPVYCIARGGIMKLSACMIVKDEHDMLPQCLQSIRKLCDEIIVVDTGSTDDSVQISESFGCKVYHHPWQNDFSLHRNQSIKYSTGGWILIIDADENLVSKVSPEHFKTKLEKLPDEVCGLVCTIKEKRDDNTGKWYGNRFFRKSSGIHYENCIHNQPKYEGFSGMTDLVINHHGYSLSPEKMKAKYKRTETLLKQRLANNPEDYEALKYMVDIHMANRNFEDAIACGTKSLELLPVISPEKMQTYSGLYFRMAKSYLSMWSETEKKEHADRAVQWAQHGIKLFPDDIDLNFTMAQIGYRADDYNMYKKYADVYTKALHEYDNPPELTQFETEIDSLAVINRSVFSVAKEHRDAIGMMRDELLRGNV